MLTASAPLEHLPSEDMALDVGVDYGFKMLVLPNINLIFRDLFCADMLTVTPRALNTSPKVFWRFGVQRR